MKIKVCPFRIGDLVRFTPSLRTQGLYQNVEGFGLKINQVAKIKKIRQGMYLYFDNAYTRGGFPWNEFTSLKKAK